MKRMKRLTCIIAALAMVMWTYIPAKADYLGVLSRSDTPTLTISNNSFSGFGDAVVTVYYVDERGVDMVIFEKVPPNEARNVSFIRIGRAKRVVIEVDVYATNSATGSLNGASPWCVGNCESGLIIETGRIVYDVQ